MRRLPRSGPGDVVGVAAPGGPVAEARIALGVTALERVGFVVRCGLHLLDRLGYVAGPDADRLADFTALQHDADVRAIFAGRGGYGCQRLVPRLDFARLDKPIVGYSDVTALLLAAYQAGVVSIHGPMVAVDWARGLSDAARDHLVRLLGDPSYAWTLPVSTGVRPGRARGRLVGGCLSVLVTTLGTPHAADTSGAVLFLEDTNEWPYELDRLLTHARQAGVFDGVAGVVFGPLETCRTHEGIAPADVVREIFRDAPFPVAMGLPAGHRNAETDVDQMALPIGTTVVLDADQGTLAAAEPCLEDA